MPTPPDPLVTADLLAIIARLTWRFLSRTTTGAELGTLTDGKIAWFLVVARGAAPNCAEWRILDTLPPRMSAWSISHATCAVLSSGRQNADGTIDYNGVRYRLVMDFDGQHNIATAEPA